MLKIIIKKNKIIIRFHYVSKLRKKKRKTYMIKCNFYPFSIEINTYIIMLFNIKINSILLKTWLLTTLTEIQKWNLCIYACDNNKKTQAQYVNWIEEQWGFRVDESTIIHILQTLEKWLSSETINPNIKRHKPVSYLELELALKKFVLDYQHQTILSDAILIEKVKILANTLKIP